MCRFQDLGQIIDLEKTAFPDDAYDKSVFLYYLVTGRDGFIVARRGDDVLGYVIATDQRRQGLILSIAVSPGARRMGIGTALMRSAIQQLATKYKRVYLQVDATEEGAIDFYRSLSFNETGKVHKRYYPNGHDALEMVRDL